MNEDNLIKQEEQEKPKKPKKSSSGHVLRDDGSGLYATGRKRKPISQDQFEELCKIRCTKQEILAVLGIADSTLDDRIREWYDSTFQVIFDQLSIVGNASLRRAQFRTAIDQNNVTMQKFLGMNILNQSDRSKQEIHERIVYKSTASDMSDEELDKELEKMEQFDEIDD